MKSKPKKIKPKKQSRQKEPHIIPKEKEELPQSKSQHFGGLPNLDLKKNLGCGG